MLWFAAAAAGILAVAGGAGAPSAGGASAEELLARALEVIGQQSVQIEQQFLEIRELREQNAQLVRVSEELRELAGEQAVRLAEANESLAVLQRMVFGGNRRRTALSLLPALAMMMIPVLTVTGSRRAGRRT